MGCNRRGSSKVIQYSVILFFLLTTFVTLIGCSDDGAASDPWPTDYGAVFTKFLNDPADDLTGFSGESPPYPVSLPSVDVTQISLGVQGNYLYIRIDYAGVIPTSPVLFPDNPPVEAQTVQNHVTNISMNTDNDYSIGCVGVGFHGVDVLYTIYLGYGLAGVSVYAIYDCVSNTDNYRRQLIGEFGQGGPGYNYVIVRYNVLDLGILFPRGTTVDVGGWSEAYSIDLNGFELYHHFAFDPLTPTTWMLPY